ncbi:MAG TPA: phosphoribosyl-AMP cyclohydrolase [Bryobacteraceae bacterium]|jgi:phosphoribosyl-AMP cyclohydrolase|nr:phosphoribosyl-AMP cyclohydrolase [Bryobacteraceae bacterium]
MDIQSLKLDFTKLGGLLPAVVQDSASRRVLMVGFMNEEAFRRTLSTGYATFYSRSRNKIWVKGESSGHRLTVKAIETDCDGDCLLLHVDAAGPGVCHEGYESCFFRSFDGGGWQIREPQTYDPAAVYGVVK